MAQGEARGHYKSVASYYDEIEGPFYEEHSDIICKWFNLQSTDMLADIGAGTGGICTLVWSKAGLVNPVLAVDPSPHMLEIAKGKQGVITMEATFDQFIGSTIISKYHKFSCVGCIHHFPQLHESLKKFYELLNPGDQLLIIEKPETALWEAARKAARNTSINEIQEYLKSAGFSDIKKGVETHYRNYKRDEYFDWLRRHCYSVLSIFTDEEIETGIAELDQTVFKGQEYKELPHTNTILLATK